MGDRRQVCVEVCALVVLTILTKDSCFYVLPMLQLKVYLGICVCVSLGGAGVPLNNDHYCAAVSSKEILNRTFPDQ